MKENRCIANCNCSTDRRDFIKKSVIITAGSMIIGNLGAFAAGEKMGVSRIRSY